MDQLDDPSATAQPSVRLGAIERRAIWGFLLYFTLLFVLFCLPIPWLGGGYARTLSGVGSALLPRGSAFSAQFTTTADPEHPKQTKPWEVVLAVEERATQQRMNIPIDTLSLTYMPVIVFLALALATPIENRRRELAILLPGLGLITLIVLLLTALPIVLLLGGLSPMRVFALGPLSLSVLSVLHRALVSPPGMTYAVPALLWWILLRATRHVGSTAI